MRRALTALLVATALLGACSDGDEADDGGDSAPRPSSTASTAPVAAVAIDWDRPTTIEAGEGWVLRDCEGDAPLVCVQRNGTDVGLIEIARFPMDTLPEAAAARRTGGDRAALEAQAEEFLESHSADRKDGCGAGYRVEPVRLTHLRAADGEIARHGFAGITAAGARSERVVQYSGIRDDTLVLVAANAYDPEGCIAPEGPTFTSAVLEEFEPVFDAVVRASPFPAGSPPS